MPRSGTCSYPWGWGQKKSSGIEALHLVSLSYICSLIACDNYRICQVRWPRHRFGLLDGHPNWAGFNAKYGQVSVQNGRAVRLN
ncbi:hypothetical protein BDV35DRAFT_358277 [Aspergillus flavus]|uniref:Uncharacterized protein n=1 Tax=Aspergillus flavus TaxID=5059 RepID=A0A5N6GRQ9_ASPFL|nr:hypothetical protein BDV35DRAFT_358277 [Aspergillus flavus]